MKIQPIVSSQLNFCQKPKEQKTLWISNMTPLQKGVAVAALWFGLGYPLDRFLAKRFDFFKSTKKFDLIFNAIWAVSMGVWTGVKAKNNK